MFEDIKNQIARAQALTIEQASIRQEDVQAHTKERNRLLDSEQQRLIELDAAHGA